MLAILTIGLEGHPIGHTCHKVAPLGEEGDHGLWRLVRALHESLQGAQGHALSVIACLLGLIVDGEDAAIEFLVVAIIVAGQFLVEEPILGILGVGMLVAAPVQLPPGVGSQFVVSAIEGVGQDKGPVALALLHFHLLSLYEVAVVVQQLDVEQAAQCRRTPVGQVHVSLVIKRVAKVVTGIIEMNEHLFLRDFLTKELEALGPPLERGRILSADCQGQEQNQQQKFLHIYCRYTDFKRAIMSRAARWGAPGSPSRRATSS